MAYPELLYRGQYTLKRVLTMPAAATLTIADVDKLVTVDSNGTVVLAGTDATFFGVLRTVNANDQICTVDFSGVHEFEASGALDAGVAITTDGDLKVKEATGNEVTRAVTLVQAGAGDRVQIFFLN